MRTLGMGVSSSLIAAAIVYWITDHNLVRAFMIGGAGVAGFLLTYLLTKRAAPPMPSVSVNQKNEPETHIENKPVFENKPTIIVSTGAVAVPAPESERAYDEVLAFLERKMQRGRAVEYFVEHIASETHLPEQRVFNALQRLFRKSTYSAVQ